MRRVIRRRAAVSAVGLAGLLVFAPLTADAAPAIDPADDVAIRQLYAQYAQALDFGDAAGLTALFAPGGTYTAEANGRRAPTSAGSAAAIIAQEPKGVRHIVTNILLTPVAGGVTGRAYGLVIVETPLEGGLIKATSAFYRDTLVKTANGWRFKEREVWTAGDNAAPTREGL